MAANVVIGSSGGRGRRGRRSVMSEINVTPFVDVMLVLLIVFMVSAPLMTLSITVDLPDARGGTANNSDKEPLILTLKKSGGGCTSQADMYLGQSPIAPTEVEAKLRAIKDGGRAQPNVLVSADRDVCYNEIMRTLGRLRTAGFGAALNVVPERGE
jgi:biopolymer transport protein TolR